MRYLKNLQEAHQKIFGNKLLIIDSKMNLLNPTQQEKIGYIIASKRKKLRISQTDFAKICDISQVTLSHLENGQFTNVNTFMTVLQKLNLDILIEDKDKLISKKPIKF